MASYREMVEARLVDGRIVVEFRNFCPGTGADYNHQSVVSFRPDGSEFRVDVPYHTVDDNARGYPASYFGAAND
jgi:hypothetical protein